MGRLGLPTFIPGLGEPISHPTLFTPREALNSAPAHTHSCWGSPGPPDPPAPRPQAQAPLLQGLDPAPQPDSPPPTPSTRKSSCRTRVWAGLRGPPPHTHTAELVCPSLEPAPPSSLPPLLQPQPEACLLQEVPAIPTISTRAGSCIPRRLPPAVTPSQKHVWVSQPGGK